jgi:kynurenine 3-monooxygenase
MFGDLVELIPDIASQYEAGTVSTISIAHSRRWVHRDKVALTGDASHAMAPFMGQGMNCGFEDARILLECLTSEDGWTQTALSRYEQLRSPDAAAIARISSEHYENLVLPPHRSLRDSARDTAKARLYSEFPLTFRPLYELCAFTDTRYGDADRHHQMTNRFVEVLLHGAGPGISEAGSTTFAAAVRAAWTTFHPDERAMAHRPPGSTDEEVLDVRRSIPHSPHGTRGC